MRYKHVFLVWLLADILLAAALFLLVTGRYVTGIDKDFDDVFLLVILYGVAFSLPSLAVLTLFYLIFHSKPRSISDCKLPYIYAIAGINVLYFLVTLGNGIMDAAFGVFYACSTAAGLLSFYLVYRKRCKNQSDKAI